VNARTRGNVAAWKAQSFDVLFLGTQALARKKDSLGRKGSGGLDLRLAPWRRLEFSKAQKM
jgi:hypothetical protein